MWIRKSARENKKGDKLNARWLGPYAIEEDLGKGVYRVLNASTGHVLKKGVNQSRLSLHRGPPPKTKPHSHCPPPGDVPTKPKQKRLSSTESGEPPSKKIKICNI